MTDHDPTDVHDDPEPADGYDESDGYEAGTYDESGDYEADHGVAGPVVERRSIWTRLYHGETAFDFVGRRRLWATLSLLVIVAGLISLGTRGLNLGIDFEGGTAWEVLVPGDEPDVAEFRDALEPLGLADAKIQVLGGDSVRVQSDNVDDALREQVAAALAEQAGVDRDAVGVNEVGPTWGEDISQKALRALIVFLIAITIYISLRFEWKMAVATLVALFHDLLVTVGVYSLSGFEVTPATVIAVLTILGYSIYDGIVVFDKVQENTRSFATTGRLTYGETVNLSLNQVLMRSLNTSITALMPILSLLVIGSFILGAVTLQDFALALLIGLAASAYSSIFIASPLLAWLKEREPRYAQARERAALRGGAPLTPASAAALDPASITAPQRAIRGGGPQAPRPRKKGRRR